MSITSSRWRPPLRRSRILEQAPPLELHRVSWVICSVVSIAVGAFQVIVWALYVLLHTCFGWSAEVWSVLVQ